MYYDRQMLHPIKMAESVQRSLCKIANLLAIATDKDDKTLANILVVCLMRA